MSDAVTKRMLEAYYSEGVPSMFFSSMFRSPAMNYYSSEEVEIDIDRSEEDVAVALSSLSEGHRYNQTDLFTNKAFKPPIFKEAVPVNSWDLLKRAPGQDPFQDVDYQAALTLKVMNAMRKVENKVRRVSELQAAQALQTGIIELYDGSSKVYELDFKMKASHKPTAATGWDQASPSIVSDLTSLADVIRKDGLINPDQLVFGSACWEAFISNEDIQKRFDMRRADLGQIAANPIDSAGASYKGRVFLGAYSFDCWTYSAMYKDPQDDTVKPYMDSGKVIMRASQGRLDATFGAVPNIGSMMGEGSRLLPALPRRMSGPGVDLWTSAWLSEDGSQLFGGIASRPLMIPVAIDTIGCLDADLS